VLGQLLKWAVELSQYVIDFEAQQAIKAQALANFFTKNAYTAHETALAADSWHL